MEIRHAPGPAFLILTPGGPTQRRSERGGRGKAQCPKCPSGHPVPIFLPIPQIQRISISGQGIMAMRRIAESRLA